MPVEMRGRHMQGMPSGPPIGGEPASHVGVPPPTKSRQPEATRAVQEASSAPNTAEEAFQRWKRASGVDVSEDQWVEAVRFEAFIAGYQMALTTVVQTAPLPGTAESRTIIAALRSFMENVLPMATEEIASGEFLSVAEVENLIAKLERTQ